MDYSPLGSDVYHDTQDHMYSSNYINGGVTYDDMMTSAKIRQRSSPIYADEIDRIRQAKTSVVNKRSDNTVAESMTNNASDITYPQYGSDMQTYMVIILIVVLFLVSRAILNTFVEMNLLISMTKRNMYDSYIGSYRNNTYNSQITNPPVKQNIGLATQAAQAVALPQAQAVVSSDV